MNSRTMMTLKSSIMIFQALETTVASLTSVASATSLASTASTALFSQKTSWSWWFDHQWHQIDQYCSFFCGMVRQKSELSLIYGTVSVGGCWGQPMLLFWKLVDKTQMPWPQEYTDTFKQTVLCIFLSVRVNLKETFQCDTLCSEQIMCTFWLEYFCKWKKLYVFNLILILDY